MLLCRDLEPEKWGPLFLSALLAEITPSQHTKTQTFLKSQNLIRHWITSFALVEHEVSLRPFAGPVQSPNGHKGAGVVDWPRTASVKGAPALVERNGYWVGAV